MITYGVNYIGTSISSITEKAGMQQPETYYDPSIAPCGMAFIRGENYGDWKGDLVIGSLKFDYLVRLDIEDDKILSQEKIATGIGRVRNVKESPSGILYVAIEGEGLYTLHKNRKSN